MKKLAECESILVVKPDLIGDVVLCTPFLRELRCNAPAARIQLVVRPGMFDLVETCPYVDEVLAYPPFEAPSGASRAQAVWMAWRTANRNWPVGFDLGILPRWDFDIWHAAYLLYFSGADRRVGYTEATTAVRQSCNRDEDLLLTDPVPSRDSGGHEVRRNLDLLEALGGQVQSTALELWTTPVDENTVARWLENLNVGPGTRLAALAPGSHEAKKRWPPERYAELCKMAPLSGFDRLLLLGGPGDRELTRRLAAAIGPRALDAGGCFSLRQSVCALRRCALFVGNDTGIKHMAAANQVPVLEVCGWPEGADERHPLSPVRFGAWGTTSRVVRPPRGCAAPSIHAVSVEAVAAVAAEMMP